MPFVRKSGLTQQEIIGLFSLKIAAGLAYAYYFSLPSQISGSDTWRFFRESIPETDWLLKDPIAFVVDLFHHSYTHSGGIFTGSNSYWNDLKSNTMIKLMAVSNVFTFRNYYTNILLFNAFFFVGLVAFFRLIMDVFSLKKWVFILTIFCLPSFLFWCSGLHKDGLLFSAIGFSFYFFHKGLQDGFDFKKGIIISLSLLLSFSLRNYICFALLANFFCWAVAYKTKLPPLQVWGVAFLVGLILFFGSSYIYSSMNLPHFIAQKQYDFMLLEGKTKVVSDTLSPTLLAFAHYFPTAFDMALLQPHINSIGKNKAFLPNVMELYSYWILAVLAIFLPKKKHQSQPLVFYACLGFVVIALFVIGYTIPFAGAVVRYRSLILPLLITPIVALLDFTPLERLRNIKKRKEF